MADLAVVLPQGRRVPGRLGQRSGLGVKLVTYHGGWTEAVRQRNEELLGCLFDGAGRAGAPPLVRIDQLPGQLIEPVGQLGVELYAPGRPPAPMPSGSHPISGSSGNSVADCCGVEL